MTGTVASRWPAAGAGVVLGLLAWLCYAVAVRTGGGQEIDASLFDLMQVVTAPVGPQLRVLRHGLPVVLGVVTAGLALGALRRGRRREVAVAAVVALAAPTLARALRLLVLDRPRFEDHLYSYNTFPSGHVAATAALGIAVVILLPGAGRAAAGAVVGLVTAVACVASVANHNHRPSDAVGGVLLALTVASVAIALLPRGAGASRPVQPDG